MCRRVERHIQKMRDWPSDAELRLNIITGDPLPAVEVIHDRRPVLLTADDIDTWLHGSREEAGKLLRPHRVGHFEINAVRSASRTSDQAEGEG